MLSPAFRAHFWALLQKDAGDALPGLQLRLAIRRLPGLRIVLSTGWQYWLCIGLGQRHRDLQLGPLD